MVDNKLLEIESFLIEFPKLIVIRENEYICIQGTLDIVLDGETKEQVQIKVIVPPSFPRELPKVFETGGRFDKSYSEHSHFNQSDTSCCLFLPEERIKYFPKNGTISDFLKGPVRVFFLNYLYFEQHGEFPHGQRSHGIQGSVEYFMEEYSEFKNQHQVKNALKVLRKKKIKKHYSCPFGCGSLLFCEKHKKGLIDLRKRIGRAVIVKSFKTFSTQEIINNINRFVNNGSLNRKNRRNK